MTGVFLVHGLPSEFDDSVLVDFFKSRVDQVHTPIVHDTYRNIIGAEHIKNGIRRVKCTWRVQNYETMLMSTVGRRQFAAIDDGRELFSQTCSIELLGGPKRCNSCLGFGHVQANCAKRASVKKSYADMASADAQVDEINGETGEEQTDFALAETRQTEIEVAHEIQPQLVAESSTMTTTKVANESPGSVASGTAMQANATAGNVAPVSPARLSSPGSVASGAIAEASSTVASKPAAKAKPSQASNRFHLVCRDRQEDARKRELTMREPGAQQRARLQVRACMIVRERIR